MKPLLLAAAALALVGSGCDSLARFTLRPSIPTQAASARHNAAEGEPGSVAGGWGLPPADGRGFAVWTHQPAPDPQNCNEFDVEPAAETDDLGHLCETYVP